MGRLFECKPAQLGLNVTADANPNQHCRHCSEPIQSLSVFEVARNPWASPVLFCTAKPMISPRELIEHASIRNNGESAGMSVLRSFMLPFCRTKARRLKFASSDMPTSSPASLMLMAELLASPESEALLRDRAHGHSLRQLADTYRVSPLLKPMLATWKSEEITVWKGVG